MLHFPKNLLLAFFFVHTFAHAESRNYVIQEIGAGYPPEKATATVRSGVPVLPGQKTLAQFGFQESNNESKAAKNSSQVACGPSPTTNTLNCFQVGDHVGFLKGFPIPGAVSSTPVFYDDSWLIGTTKGFLIRVKAQEGPNHLPDLGGFGIGLWGSYSRQMMQSFRPKTFYLEDKNQDNNEAKETTTPSSANPDPDNTSSSAQWKQVKWIFSSSSEFLGTPVVKNGLAYVISASQYLEAIDWQTGKLAWAIHLAPDVAFRANTLALTVTDNYVIVGNSLGSVQFLNPKDGSIQKSLQVGTSNISIGAPPLVDGDNLVVSNSENITQNISLSNYATKWSLPAGSVVTPISYKNNVIIAAQDGSVTSLDLENGANKWRTEVNFSSPLISMVMFEEKNSKNIDKDLILVATQLGQLALIDAETGKLLSKRSLIGDITGYFFMPHSNSACLSFASNGLRCFTIKSNAK